MLTITKMATVRKPEIMWDKFNVSQSTVVNYAQK